MPRGDRSGPDSMGPMTGRRAGYCAGYGAPGYVQDFGRGRGRGGYSRRGPGGGHEFRWREFGAEPGRMGYRSGQPMHTLTKEEEEAVLKQQLEYLEQELNTVRERLGTLKPDAEQ